MISCGYTNFLNQPTNLTLTILEQCSNEDNLSSATVVNAYMLIIQFY